MSCPAGITVNTISGVSWRGRGDAGAPDETKSCQAACWETVGGETWRTQPRLTDFWQQRSGGCGWGLGCCCGSSRSRRSLVAGNLVICSWKGKMTLFEIVYSYFEWLCNKIDENYIKIKLFHFIQKTKSTLVLDHSSRVVDKGLRRRREFFFFLVTACSSEQI